MWRDDLLHEGPNNFSEPYDLQIPECIRFPITPLIRLSQPGVEIVIREPRHLCTIQSVCFLTRSEWILISYPLAGAFGRKHFQHTSHTILLITFLKRLSWDGG